jgi:putative metalloprotease
MKKIVLFLGITVGLPVLSHGQGLGQAVADAIGSVTVTNEQVAQYSKQAVQQMDAKNPVAGPNDPYTQRLNGIIGAYRTIDNIPINYKVYNVKDVNAFATADGSVRVFKGLMDLMSDDEVLAVIGHEIGHVINQDSRDAMKSALRRSAVRNALGSGSGAIGKLSRSQLGDVADGFLGAKFSRDQESQADDYSYDFLKRNGKNVVALATSFEKLAKLSGGSQGGKVAALMSSHPDSKARSERIYERARRDGLTK